MPRPDFVARYGGVYEHSPWIAEAVAEAGLSASDAAPAALAARMAAIVEAAGEARQLALLRAHPKLAGRLAIGGGLTKDSQTEQAAAKLDQCTPAEFRRFNELNTRYGAKFGFPFIIAVRGLDRAEILAAFERRVGNDRATELRAALDEVHKIARLRLDAMAR